MFRGPRIQVSIGQGDLYIFGYKTVYPTFSGSDIDVLNCHKEGPLHLAIRKSHVDIAKLLVAKGKY